jgi:Transposase
MRFAGIDIGGERHAVAVVDEAGAVLVRSTYFEEEAAGYELVKDLLDDPDDCLVAMEAAGHYWRNLFTFLVGHGFKVALLNPLRTRRSPWLYRQSPLLPLVFSVQFRGAHNDEAHRIGRGNRHRGGHNHPRAKRNGTVPLRNLIRLMWVAEAFTKPLPCAGPALHRTKCLVNTRTHQSSRRFPLINFGITGVTENCKSHFCPKTSEWTGIYCPWTASFTGRGPIFTTLPIFRPIGKVTILPLLFAYQFTSMLGDVPTDQPAAGKYEKKYCRFI